MFIKEDAPESFKELYCHLSGGWWDEKRPNTWFADHDKQIYINMRGKQGAETPVFFYMYYQGYIVEFAVWDYDEHDEHVYVKIPDALKYQKSEIESVIRTAHEETDAFTHFMHYRVNEIKNCEFKWSIYRKYNEKIILHKSERSVSMKNKDYVIIQVQDIISAGTTKPPLGRHSYIIYLHPEDRKIHINTDFRRKENQNYQCCMHYDRILCNSLAEFSTLPEKKIQNQAYGAWMDGAHS